MKKLVLVTVLIITLIGNGAAQMFPNPATLSTGQGATNTLDPLWLISSWYTGSPPNPIGLSYNPALINNNCAPGAWVNPAALPSPVNNGNWITGSDNTPCTGQAGYRYYRLTIDLPPDCNGNSVTIAGNYILYFAGYVDNGISDVFINGNSTGINGGNFMAGGQLNITLIGPWVAGINYIDVLVYNGGGPYGLLLVANTTASSLSDGDGDGTADINDQCPCTPGSLANGCPASIIGDTIICKGESTTLTSTGTGTYLWNTGSTNSSITISPALTAVYHVVVTTSSGFKDSSAVNVTVRQPPLISITGDTLLCVNESTTLTALGGGTYAWSTGSANAAIAVTPASTANYKVVVTNTFGCKDSLSQNVTVFPKPASGFTFTNKCDGTAVPFNSTSTIITPGVITNWSWNFGDNASANVNSTSHIYGSPGNYNVSLIVNSANSCADTIIHQIAVFNNPSAGFIHSDVCYGDTIHFTDTSIVNLPSSISNYLWIYGDASPSGSSQNTDHYYSHSGSFQVTLVITTSDGCSAAANISVNTFDAPAAVFASSSICLHDSAHFINNSISPSMGSIAGWSWDFGDGSPLNTTSGNPYHLYASPGNYQVTLITHSSNLGCPDTLKSPITVFPLPAAKFVFRNVCLNQPMNFYDSSTVSSGNIAGWSWSFGDGTPVAALQNPSHTYSLPGNYNVTLIVNSSDGCKDTVIKNVVVHALPAAQFNTASVCSGTAVHFNDVSHILATDTIQYWRWNFGDGTVFNTNQNSTHLYASPGSFVVQLFIVSKFGCVDSTIKTSVVNPNPVVNFKGDDTVGCEPVCVNFQNLSSVLTGTNTAWLWTFGIGSGTSILKDPSHCYSNDSVFSPVSFNITLKATSDSGCVTIFTKNNYITVYPKPAALFAAQPNSASIINPVISITDLSAGTNFWHWNFGDSDTTFLHNPASYAYTDTGTYVITLITSTLFNCADTAYKTIVIEPDFVFYIPNAFTPDGDGINDTFAGKGMFITDYEMMIFDRWGSLIFYSNDKNIGWDGRANHGTETAQRDEYIYSIKITDFNKRKHSYKGKVALLR